MSIAVIALVFAGAGAGWLLWTLARGGSAIDARASTVLKAVVWFGLVAALAVAKLWPLAFMVLAAAGGVMAIEMWRDRTVRESEAETSARRPDAVQSRMDGREAASILGVAAGADETEIRSAHRKLIAQIHPDKGGTDYLAAKINEARDVLLQERGGLVSEDRSNEA